MNNTIHSNIGKKVMVVEDESALLSALVSRLENEGFEVVQARDGQEGLEQAGSARPELILLDILMPKMNGLEMLDKLREHEWGKSIKVIILTNLGADDKQLEKIIVDQPSYYLLKSDISLEQIIEKVHEVLQERKEGDTVN